MMSCHLQPPRVWTPCSWKNDQSTWCILKQLQWDVERHFEKSPDAIRVHGLSERLTSRGRKPSFTHLLLNKQDKKNKKKQPFWPKWKKKYALAYLLQILKEGDQFKITLLNRNDDHQPTTYLYTKLSVDRDKNNAMIVKSWDKSQRQSTHYHYWGLLLLNSYLACLELSPMNEFTVKKPKGLFDLGAFLQIMWLLTQGPHLNSIHCLLLLPQHC